MNLSEISQRLRRTAESIDSNSERLNRPKFLKQADAFLKTLQKFDFVISEHSIEPPPEVYEIETALKALFGDAQDSKGIAQIAKAVFGAATNPKKDELFSVYVSRVAEQAVALEKLDPMRQALQTIYNQRAESESLQSEEDLIMKVVFLTDLDAEQLAREEARLIGNPELFARLARAVNIPVKATKSGKPAVNKALFKKLMAAAHRLDRNIQR
jgi:hypothetical protein